MHYVLMCHLRTHCAACFSHLFHIQPLTAITEALDGAGKLYELKSFSEAKSVDQNREVRQAADHVYGLLVDLPSLFARRRLGIAFAKAKQLATIPTDQRSWANYVVSRLTVTTEARKLHTLFRPEGMSGSYYDGDASVAPSVAASQTPSIMALSRLGENLRDSRMEMNVMWEDEEERLFGPSDNPHLDENVEKGFRLPVGTDNDDAAASESESNLADELFSEHFSYANDSNNMLASFNYAVSSSGGRSELSGSVMDSDRSGSPPPGARGRFSYGREHSARGSGVDGETEEDLESNFVEQSETEREPFLT